MMIKHRTQWKDKEWINFKPSEFYCRHCRIEARTFLRMQEHVIDKIQMMRTQLNFPFIITDASRCDNHPRVIAKEKRWGKGYRGSHPSGVAVDIVVANEDQFWQIYQLAKDMGARGIGNGLGFLRGDFIHVDWWTKRSPDRVEEWSY